MAVYLSRRQILHVHQRQIERFGGSDGIRDERALDAAIARPRATFGGEDLYPTLARKAGALLHSLVANHPFVDGNKRVGATGAELLVLINGFEIDASDDAMEELTMTVARGNIEADEIAVWIDQRLVPLR